MSANRGLENLGSKREVGDMIRNVALEFEAANHLIANANLGRFNQSLQLWIAQAALPVCGDVERRHHRRCARTAK